MSTQYEVPLEALVVELAGYEGQMSEMGQSDGGVEDDF